MTAAERPTTVGDVRIRTPDASTDSAAIEVWAGTEWVSLRGVTRVVITMLPFEVVTAALDIDLMGGVDMTAAGLLRKLDDRTMAERFPLESP